MVEDAKPQESSPEIEGAIASSPEALNEAQEKVTETPTPQEGETPPVKEEQGETPLHEQPRFKEVIDEKNWYKQQLEQVMAKQQQPPQQPTPTDPYAGMTPEEKVFWMKQREIAKEEAEKVLHQNVNPQIQQGIQEIARLRVEQFRKDHSDIRPDSPEEMQIAEKIRSGYLPEDAYRAVMWDRKVGEKEATNQQTQQQRLEAKRKANVVSPQSVSSAAAPSKKETYEEELARKLNTEWDGKF